MRTRRVTGLGWDGAPPADAGSAVVELVTLGVVLLLPVVYLIVAVARIQAASFAVDGSAREAARSLVTASSQGQGWARAATAVRLGLADQGFDVHPQDVTVVVCSADPCLTPGGWVSVTVAVDVVLPGVPDVVDRMLPARVRVRSTAVLTVDEFAEGPPE